MNLKVWRRRTAKWQSRRFKGTDRLARRVLGSLIKHITGNQLTLMGFAASVPMIYFYLADQYLVASLLLIFSALTDWFDGAVAVAQQGDTPVMTYEEEMRLTFWQRINYRGVTHLGKWLDPLTDKVRFLGALYPLGWGVVDTWLIAALTTVALGLMAVRPLKRRLGMGDGSSNRLGKIKAWSEYAALSLLVFYPASKLLLDLIFSVALLLGCGSLSGHILAGTVALAKRRRARRKERRYRRSLIAIPDRDQSP
ncbi:CDP-alcohol phosphatidyltransferase family protein [Candidatus Parcubacteria bacterium]|nr:CDP-alcohol phosphatidyltransferase family protein [Candidatus Parcubacteria bacterium]